MTFQASQAAAHEPEVRRQALKDRKPLLPEGSGPRLDGTLAEQVDSMLALAEVDGNTDVLAIQAKAGS